MATRQDMYRRTDAELERLIRWHVARSDSNGDWTTAQAAQDELDRRKILVVQGEGEAAAGTMADQPIPAEEAGQ